MKVTKSEEIYSGVVLKLTRDQIQLEDGQEYVREVVGHPGAVVMIPQDTDGRLLLVRQYRYPIGTELLEFPAGTLDPNEPPDECAKRELAEEVGKGAREWTDLGILYPCPGFCTEKQYLYLARDLFTQKLEGDPDENITVEALTVDEVEEAIANGGIVDAKSIAIFHKAKSHIS